MNKYWMRAHEIFENTSRDWKSIILDNAWEQFLSNCSMNDGETDDLRDDYEDDTGNKIQYPVGRHNERMIEFSDPIFTQWCRDRVINSAHALILDIEHSLHGSFIQVWRAIEAAPDWKPEEETRDHIHWSRTIQKAQAYFGGSERGHVIHLISGLMPVTSVNWEETVRANLSSEFGSDEDEIAKLPNAPMKIIGVQIIKR